jgi:DNA-binding transcriptional regulator YdaS (Cro superfamily)
MLKNIPAKELAELLGVSTGFISHIKTGHRKMPPKYCVRVSRKYRIPLHDLRPDIFPDD